MTNEEAKKWLKKLYIMTDITDEYGDMIDMQPFEEAVNMAIKSLDTLDKIRVEIDTLKSPLASYGDWYDGVADCLRIIDKYRKESEGV